MTESTEADIIVNQQENITENTKECTNTEHGQSPQEPLIKIKPLRLNRTEKKRLKFERKRANYKQRKEEKKLKKRIANEKAKLESTGDAAEAKKAKPAAGQLKYETFLNHRQLKERDRERLRQVYVDSSKSLKICIDCSFSDMMSHKEMSRLSQQIGRCHASNKSLNSPVHLTLCNLDTSSAFHKELLRMNDGFSNYIIEKSDKSVEDYYIKNQAKIAYMSPDSENQLESLDVDTTYIIGGLVDETVAKKVTIGKCDELDIKSYSLPVEKYMSRKTSSGDGHSKIFNYSKILAINQVFDILADFFVNKDWPKALASGVPKRKGFYVDDNLVHKEQLEDSEATTK